MRIVKILTKVRRLPRIRNKFKEYLTMGEGEYIG